VGSNELIGKVTKLKPSIKRPKGYQTLMEECRNQGLEIKLK